MILKLVIAKVDGYNDVKKHQDIKIEFRTI